MDDVVAWRKAIRKDLIAARQGQPAAQRARAAVTIGAKLDRLLARLGVSVIGLYWPIRGEVNLRRWAEALAGTGRTLCLPVVVRPNAPIEYWRWVPGEAMRDGAWGIPVPAVRRSMAPEMVLAPLVGFDRARYRLGYGSGYFDRTLAASTPRPIAIGVGFACGALETIFPQPHDIAMDAIITEAQDFLPAAWSDHGN